MRGGPKTMVSKQQKTRLSLMRSGFAVLWCACRNRIPYEKSPAGPNLSLLGPSSGLMFASMVPNLRWTN